MFRDRTEPTLFRDGTVPETVPVRSLIYAGSPVTVPLVITEHTYGNMKQIISTLTTDVSDLW